MSDLGDFDVDEIWLSSSTWRGQQNTAHLDPDCVHLDGTETRGPIDPMTLHRDTPVCKQCDPTLADSFGGNRTGPSIAQQLRYGTSGSGGGCE